MKSIKSLLIFVLVALFAFGTIMVATADTQDKPVKKEEVKKLCTCGKSASKYCDGSCKKTAEPCKEDCHKEGEVKCDGECKSCDHKKVEEVKKEAEKKASPCKTCTGCGTKKG